MEHVGEADAFVPLRHHCIQVSPPPTNPRVTDSPLIPEGVPAPFGALRRSEPQVQCEYQGNSPPRSGDSVVINTGEWIVLDVSPPKLQLIIILGVLMDAVLNF